MQAAIRAALLLGLAATPLVYAQAGAGPAPAAGAHPDTVRAYAIAAGPLDRVLTDFASAAGVELVVDAALTQHKNSAGLTGSFTAAQGFARLLAEHGLQAVRGANGAYALRPAVPAALGSSAAGAAGAPVATLGAVTVVAGSESATAPVRGYVARRAFSATKTDTPLIESPQSVSVITADEIGDRKAETLDEVLRYTAGITPNMKAWAVDEFSLLRGFDLGTAGIFLDGLLTSGRAYAAPIEPYGLERLEVLRGPASVLYGQTPPGGMVNAVSKRPSADAPREVGIEYGSYQRRQLKADVGGSLGDSGAWTYRVTLLARDANTRIVHDRDRRLYVAPALTWRPNADTSLTLLARYQQDDQQYQWPNQIEHPGAAGQADPRVSIGGRDNRWDRDNRMLGYEFEHRFNSVWKLSQNLRYSQFDRSETNLFHGPLQADGRTVQRRFSPRETHWQGVLADTRLHAAFAAGGVEHNVLFGVDYARSRTTNEYIYRVSMVAPFDLLAPDYSVRPPVLPAARPEVNLLPSTQTGLYLQDQIKWGRLVTAFGVRRDKADTSATVSYPGTGEAGFVAYDQSASATTGRVGAVYLLDGGWAPYVSYATSFAPEVGTSVTGDILKPSKGKQFEAGLRYQAPDSRATYTLSVFDLVRNNVTTAAPGVPGEVIQTGEVQSRGLETEARADVTRNVSVVAQYTYLDTEITRSNNGDRGLAQQSAPRHNASVWARYAFAAAPGVRGFGALGIRYIGKARSAFDSDNLNVGNPAMALLDGALGFDRGAWHVAINLNNVLDKQYLTDCGGGLCYRSAERTVNVSASYRF